jgi:ElaB/YqjD/DUF883 family membrane-anchored ribosome-binding protein
MATPTSSNPFPTSDAPLSGEVGDMTGMSSSSAASSDTVNRVVQGAHQAVDRIAERAAPVVERLKSSMSGASDSMHTSVEQWNAMQEEWVETARTTVREHPIASLAAAVAAGVVLSKLLSSR